MSRLVKDVESGKLSLKLAFLGAGAPDVNPLPELPNNDEDCWFALMPSEFSEVEDTGGLVPDATKVKSWHWEVLAPPHSPQSGILKVLLTLQVNPMYPEGARRETAQLVQKAPGMIADPSLKDMTQLAFVTIDNDDSRDLDQAMYIKRCDEGYQVYYALADAAYFIKNGSALFKEALRRGSSFYLPQFTCPMLPAALSEDVISINPNVDRRALVFTMTLDKDGNCLKTVLERCRVKSRAKLSYKGVQEYHDAKLAGKGHRLGGKDYTETLDLLKEVGDLRIAEAQRRDVVRYDSAEISIGLNNDKTGFRDYVHTRYDTDKWNEQISLLCNAEGAKFFLQDLDKNPQVQPVFRVHEAPEEEKLASLVGFIDNLVKEHDIRPADGWKWSPGSVPVAHYLADIDKLVAQESNVEKKAEMQRVSDAIERQFLMANHRSVFSVNVGEHYALGIGSYARFSSPMREVVGIFTHKEALEKMFPNLASNDEWDEELRLRVIKVADDSKQKQSKINKAVLELAIEQFGRHTMLVPLKNRVRHDATIMGMTHDRVYVLTKNPEVDIKIYKDDMDHYLGCGTWELVGDEIGVEQKRGSTRELHSGVLMVPNSHKPLKIEQDRNRSRSPDMQQRSKSRDGRRPPSNKQRGKGSYIRREESPPPNSTPATAEQIKAIGGWTKQLRVGDVVKVMVTGYNPERRRWIFLPVQ